MGKRYYLVSAAAIATMAALAIPASAQPFSETMGSWGYGDTERSVRSSGSSS